MNGMIDNIITEQSYQFKMLRLIKGLIPHFSKQIKTAEPDLFPTLRSCVFLNRVQR